jgi:shikimate dehydrogenase
LKALRFAVVGDPVAHSKSPVMHAAAFRALGLPHTYEAVRVPAEERSHDAEGLRGIVQDLRDGKWAGLNVTVPYKAWAAAIADERDASACGAEGQLPAANTLVRTPDGRVKAYNTDVPALAAELRILAGPLAPWSAMRSLVLGAGGAAWAATMALRALGAKDVAVRARTAGNVFELLKKGRMPLPVTQAWQPSRGSEEGTIAVVQATSAGMTGADPGETVAGVVAWDALPKDAVALDVVYAPPETPFLRAAAARGLRHANGLGMLARQGALALELWLGVPAPLEAMLAALG